MPDSEVAYVVRWIAVVCTGTAVVAGWVGTGGGAAGIRIYGWSRWNSETA